MKKLRILFAFHKSVEKYKGDLDDEIQISQNWWSKLGVMTEITKRDFDLPITYQTYGGIIKAISVECQKSIAGKIADPGEFHIIYIVWQPEAGAKGIFTTYPWYKANGSIIVCIPLTEEEAKYTSQWMWRAITHESIHACFPPTTPVLTQGFLYKPIKDVKPGDLVFTHTGQLKRVIEVMKRPWQGRMRQITIFGDYRPIICTREHPFWAIKKSIAPISKKKILGKTQVKDKVPQFYFAYELEKGDWVGMPFNDIIKDTTVFDFEKDPDFLWVLGLYLAEGDLDNKRKYTKGGQVRFTLNKKETYLYERIEKTMKKYGAETGYWEGKGAKANIITAYINGRFWADVFKELGGEYSYSKKLNERLMYIDPKLQYQIFEGWKDGDGHVRSKNKETIVATVSYDLAIQMRTILLRNHIFNSLSVRKGGIRNILGHNSQTRDTYIISFSPTSKDSFIKDNCLFVLIKDAKDIYTTKNGYDGGYVYNLEVEDDNSYQVNGVAVHNCFGLLNLNAGIKVLDIQDQSYAELRKIKPNPTEDDYTQLSESIFNTWIKPHLDKLYNEPIEFQQATILKQLIGLLTALISLITASKRKRSVIERLAECIAQVEGFYKEGTLANRNNNPGNLVYSPYQAGQKDGFAYFQDQVTGWKALYYQLELIFKGESKYYTPSMTIMEFVDTWASTSPYSERFSYAKYIATAFGVDIYTKLNELK